MARTGIAARIARWFRGTRTSDGPVDAANLAGTGRLGKTATQDTGDQKLSAELSSPAPDRKPPTPPKVAGYELHEPLGEGAYGQVWRATQLRTKKEVAVKVFTQRTGLDWIFLQREAERLTRLDRHPHIVTLLDTGLAEEPPYYTMDLIEGGSLEQFVDTRAVQPADAARALRWMGQVCDALSYVHAKGLIHCDLKPANILLDTEYRVRVVDFGQSRVFTESAASLGTLFYMPPEQAVVVEEGKPIQPDVRWDVYALGATMYSILTGRVPHADAGTVRELEAAPDLAQRLERYRERVSGSASPPWNGADVRAELQAVIEQCMAHAPEQRYETIAAVDADLQALARKRPVRPLARSSSYRAKKFLQRNPFQTGLAAAVVLASGLGLLARIQSNRLARSRATELVAAFVHDPTDAVEAFGKENARVSAWAEEIVDRYVRSPAFAERIMGARAGPWLDPDAFWQSVDGGPLWRHGEWLELLSAFEAGSGAPGGTAVGPFEAALLDRVQNGTARQTYVAACLVGHLGVAAREIESLLPAVLASQDDVGAVMACWWAARRAGLEMELPDHPGIFSDPVSGLVFVQVPTTESFRRGSPASEADRYADEDQPAEGVPIGPVYVSNTELVLSSLAGFLNDPAVVGQIPSMEAGNLRKELAQLSSQQAAQIAAGFISLHTARAYCDWLNRRAAGQTPRRHYRLLTEDEWEYACRAGNAGRFCYGDDAEYARYFAHSNGSGAVRHTVAQRMPNAFGLFDVHGGVWEWTDSAYPAHHLPDDVRAAGGDYYVLRGGAWYSPAVRCRCAQRYYASPARADRYYGARLALEMDR